MSDELSVSATGETVGEAKWAAVRELERLAPGLDRDAIRFQVVSEGERGLLGVGTTPAEVVASVPAPAEPAQRPAADPELPRSEAEVAEGIVRHALAALGVQASVEVAELADEVVVTAGGPAVGILIGRHGQMLDALQVLANAIAQTQLGDERRRIVVDAAGYRDRRRDSLETLARRTAERVAATGRPSSLEPMAAGDRRIVHEALKDDPEVETASEGIEPYRCVVVLPRHATV